MVKKLKGNLQDYRLSDTLIGFQKGRADGTLRIADGTNFKKVVFENGDIVFASSDDKEEQIGEFLLKEGKITLEEYNQLSDISSKKGLSIEKALVKYGYLIPAELSHSVKHQVEEIILGLFAIKEGRFEFHNDLTTDETEPGFKFHAADTVYKGIIRINSFTHLKRLCPPIDAVLSPCQSPLDIFRDIVLNDSDKKILSYVNGLYSVKLVLMFSPLSDFETLKRICAFVGTGLVSIKRGDEKTFRPPVGTAAGRPGKITARSLQEINEMYKKCEHMNLYETLGLEQDASIESVGPEKEIEPGAPVLEEGLNTEAEEKHGEEIKTEKSGHIQQLAEVAAGVSEYETGITNEAVVSAEKRAVITRRRIYIPLIAIILIMSATVFAVYNGAEKDFQQPLLPDAEKRISLPPLRDDLFKQNDGTLV